jgi:hypothetical protein
MQRCVCQDSGAKQSQTDTDEDTRDDAEIAREPAVMVGISTVGQVGEDADTNKHDAA